MCRNRISCERKLKYGTSSIVREKRGWKEKTDFCNVKHPSEGGEVVVAFDLYFSFALVVTKALSERELLNLQGVSHQITRKKTLPFDFDSS